MNTFNNNIIEYIKFLYLIANIKRSKLEQKFKDIWGRSLGTFLKFKLI